MSGSRRSMGLGAFFFYYGTLPRNGKSLPEVLSLLMGDLQISSEFRLVH
jgi:hypothetical protein